MSSGRRDDASSTLHTRASPGWGERNGVAAESGLLDSASSYSSHFGPIAILHKGMSENRQVQSADDGPGSKLRQLEAELKATQKQLAAVVELLGTHKKQIEDQGSSIARLDRILMEILTGRTWRTLRATGEFVKRFVPRTAGPGSNKLAGPRSYLVCDEPILGDSRPRSGMITVRGWCLCDGGVDAVQVDIFGLPRMEVTSSVARPDVKRRHPDLDFTGRAGFSVEFDSTLLPNGSYPITVRILSKGIAVRESKTSVVIDHEKGFSSEYDRWIQEFETPDTRLFEVQVPAILARPLISILLPVFNTEPVELEAAIHSVIDQSYENWELCVADDFSSRPETRAMLQHLGTQDDRIKVVLRRERGGISNACNTAWQMAAGEYLTFLDHDDTLAPHALAYVCDTIGRIPEADFIYSDEDKLDEKGRRFQPFFKPDWSPDLLCSENYICHLLVLRRDLADKIGRFDPACDGSQDYDLILRATAAAKHIQHIPKILYHWRAGANSTATTIENKQYALEAAQRALDGHCKRSDLPMHIESGIVPGRWRARYQISPDDRVSIIIASGGKADVLRTNITTLLAKTAYPNYEIVVIDNSRAEAIRKLVDELRPKQTSIRYIDWRNKPFNYSQINNAAARQCSSPVLLFLNDDTSVIEPGWLEAMVELISRPEVGAVGAKLLYPDRRIQHGGVVMGLYDNCGHAFKGLDGGVSHYFDFSDVIRNVSAVTGACLMTRAALFWEVGGFNETEFAVAFNDIDLCLKIGASNHRVLYTPHALLYHHEAFSKTSKDLVPHPQEVASMRSRWGKIIAWDPFYSPNLTRNDENFSLRSRS